MATDEENVTDKHDESNTAQFGDDPHHLTNTPFEESACTECGIYVVVVKNFTGTPRCITHGRTHAGVEHASGQPIGHWYPVTGYQPPRMDRETRTAPGIGIITATWQWGCINCQETGTALNAPHATAMHKIHTGYSCPAAPGISTTEIRNRLQRRAALTRLWPQQTPPMHLKQWPNGTYTAEPGNPQ